MSEIQAADKFMRGVAIIGGIIAVIESILHMFDFFEFWSFGIITEIIALILAIIVILLGIKPIHYTPAVLGGISILLIIFGSFIGGIIVLLAALIGAIT